MAIDIALKKLLEERGMTEQLKSLEEADRKGGFIATVKEAAKQFFIPYSEAQKQVIAPVAKFVAPIGESIGGAIFAGKIKTPIGTIQTKESKEFEKAQEETLKREVELHNQTLRQLRDPKLSKQDKFRVLLFNAQNNPNLLEEIPEINKTAKQIFGEGAVTAFNTLFALSGVSRLKATGAISRVIIEGGRTIQQLGKIKDAPRISRLAGTLLRTSKEVAIGAGFGAAVAMEKEEDIKKTAGLFAGISAFAPPILGRIFKFSSKTIGKIATTVNDAALNRIPKLKSISESIPMKTGNFLIDSSGSARVPFKNTVAQFGERVLEAGTRPLEPALIDRLHNIKVFDKFVESITGTKISNTPNSAYIKARNFAGVPQGKFTVGSDDFNQMFSGETKQIKDELLGYIKGLDLLNRANRGQALEAGKTALQIQKELTDIEARIIKKVEGLDLLKNGVKNYNEFTKTKILNEYVNSGLLASRDAENMLNANPNWTPHDVLDFFENKASEAFMKGGSFNVSDNAIKVARGSERELAAVDVATLHRMQQAQILAERNRVMRSVFEKVEKDPESFGFIKLGTEQSDELIIGKTLKEIDIKKAGFEKVSYFKDGIREDWLIPEDLGIALKNLDATQTGIITKWLKIPADILRAGATRLNVAFSLSNFPRDLQTAAGISKNGLTKRQVIDALNDVTNFNNPQTRAFYEGGGAFGGLIGAEKPSKDILMASKKAPIFKVGDNIAKMIESVGERVENATRFAVYKNAIANGMQHDLAIFEARNATVDFSKMGNVIGIINKVIPFLNARVQGLVNMTSSLNQDPTKFVRRQLFQSVWPAMYLYSHNSNFTSFDNIPQWERDQNWIVMYGEQDGQDNSGAPIKVPLYIKIKKGEIQQVFANTVEQYLDLSNKENPREIGKFLQDQILNVSPVNISSFGPLSTPIELTANYDLFRRAPIEREFQPIVDGGKQFPREQIPIELRTQKSTGQTAKSLSVIGLDKANISPSRIEFIIGKIFGTAGKDLLRLIDMTQTGLDQTGLPEGEASKAQILSRTPIFRTFIGSNSAAEKILYFELAKKIDKRRFDEIDMPKELEVFSYFEMAKEIQKKQGVVEANKYLQSLDLDKDMVKRFNRIKENNKKGETNFVQVFNRMGSNGAKTEFLIKIINQLPTREAQNQLLLDVDPHLSKDLKNRIRNSIEQKLIIGAPKEIKEGVIIEE